MAELGLVGDGPASYQVWLGGTPNQSSLAECFMDKVKLQDLDNVLEPLFSHWKRVRLKIESGECWLKSMFDLWIPFGVNRQPSIKCDIASLILQNRLNRVATRTATMTPIIVALKTIAVLTPEDTELQCVPGQFESVEEYVRVFEPLLFEECRAQLFSTLEESTEASSRDLQVARIKGVERRERGWFDVIIFPVNETKWMFKEGEVAVLSSSKPGSVRYRRNTSSSTEEDKETEANGRVIGTIRRHIPIDTRDPIGAILLFYVGDSYDRNRCKGQFFNRVLNISRNMRNRLHYT